MPIPVSLSLCLSPQQPLLKINAALLQLVIERSRIFVQFVLFIHISRFVCFVLLSSPVCVFIAEPMANQFHTYFFYVCARIFRSCICNITWTHTQTHSIKIKCIISRFWSHILGCVTSVRLLPNCIHIHSRWEIYRRILIRHKNTFRSCPLYFWMGEKDDCCTDVSAPHPPLVYETQSGTVNELDET